MKSKQQFKGMVLSRTKVKNNILHFYNQSDKSDQYDWYADAHKFATELSKDYDLPVSICAGIISALSPMKMWEQNKKCAISFLQNGNAKHMGAFQRKAEEIFTCSGDEECIKAILKGRKIISFFINIMHPHKADNVTIDRHALSVALRKWVREEDYSGITKGQYKFLEDCYKYTADIIGISPVLLQSTTWERFRKIKQNY